MTKLATPYTPEELTLLRREIANKTPSRMIARMFPKRPWRAVFSKVRYEKARVFNKQYHYISSAPDAPAIPDAYAVSSELANENQDTRFQNAMRAAIHAGLERAPAPSPVDYAEFRPAPFHPAPRVSYGGSPAAQCAELGAA